ncbi:pilus assembly PilX family protein [Ramlibacter sp. Leaf400]|uniref:pilus assembly PilX family protein n=1 Tax=Ramlibacter sp. Leaf400 TaxID=1736365 RepID=UPI001F32EFE0|nr:hypothetical protein [Ramlibacter sp. Leaf400]
MMKSDPTVPARRTEALLLRATPRRKKQHGIVLIVSIVLLVIVSVLAAFSTRNAASTENISGNVRLTELATQAAELALRHCEDSVAEVIAVGAGAAASYDTTFTLANILPAGMEGAWQSAAQWDSATSPAYVVPLARVNQSDLTTTYKRPPECMVAPVPFVLPNGSISTTAAFIVTARGFGPEVSAADADRSRPVGTEIWLQSQIELQ